MSTGAIITMSIVWAYVIFFVIYFFIRIVKSDKEAASKLNEQSHESNT